MPSQAETVFFGLRGGGCFRVGIIPAALRAARPRGWGGVRRSGVMDCLRMGAFRARRAQVKVLVKIFLFRRRGRDAQDGGARRISEYTRSGAKRCKLDTVS